MWSKAPVVFGAQVEWLFAFSVSMGEGSRNKTPVDKEAPTIKALGLTCNT